LEVNAMKREFRPFQKSSTGLFSWIFLLLLFAVLFLPQGLEAATRSEINRDVNIALEKLYRTTPAAKKISNISKGVLVFPSIIKGGLIVGGAYGEGALRINGKTKGYYNTVSASYGFQAGAQSYGYAIFFLDQKSLDYLNKSEGWELGTAPNIVVVDKGAARDVSTTTANSGIYVFFFNQKGLMASLSIEGSKITAIHPK
jgi:lipid-binding SYLF domain-containing protein